jgi:hypothetical protein
MIDYLGVLLVGQALNVGLDVSLDNPYAWHGIMKKYESFYKCNT